MTKDLIAELEAHAKDGFCGSRGHELLTQAAQRIRELTRALTEIDAECQNHGFPNEIVMERMIERIELFARQALNPEGK